MAGGQCWSLKNYFWESDDVFYSDPFASFADLYPVDDIKVAAQHLLYYCCEKNLIADTGEQSLCPAKDSWWQLPADLLYAESAYIFDHLVDIGMRRLSWSPAEQYPDAWLDPKAQERRELVVDYATKPAWAVAGSIIEAYKEYRNIQQPMPSVYWTYDLERYTQQWETFGLKNKFFATCYLAKELAWVFLNDYNIPYQPPKNTYNACLWLSNKVIQQEFAYTKQVLIQQSANLLQTNFATYSDSYFVRDRMQTLFNKLSILQTDFLSVSQKVNEWTQTCSS